MKNSKIVILILGLLSLTPLIWFLGKGNILINGSDTNFPLDPLVWISRRFFVWNSFPNAGSIFSSSLAGLFFHAIQVIPYLVGFNLQVVEILSLVFWFAAILFSGFFFSRVSISKNPVICLTFSVFYSFNTYILNTWENVKVANLALMAALPLILGIYILFLENKLRFPKAILFVGLVGILASGSGINPAYFLCLPFILILTAIVYSLKAGNSIGQIWLKLLVVNLVLLLVNFYWLLPTTKYLFFSGKNITKISDIGFTNWLDSLSQHTSLDNVIRMQGAWDWYASDDAGNALYIPYSVNYFRRIPFVLFSFLIPALAMVSLIFRKKREDKTYFLFVLLFVLSVFLGVGTHDPSGYVYRILVKYLPFFSFFRSPWYIFTPYLALSTAGLVALLLESISVSALKKYVLGISSVLIVGNIVYTYPLITGKIFRPGRQDGFYTSFPNYIFETKSWLEKEDIKGRIIGYPDDEIERFEWGYNAVESILSLFYKGEVIFAPFEEPPSNLTLLIRQFYWHLKRGQSRFAWSLTSKLGVALFFNKGDQSSLAPYVGQTKLGPLVNQFGPWGFYNIPSEFLSQKISATDEFYKLNIINDPTKVMPFFGFNQTLVGDRDSVVREIKTIIESSGSAIYAKNLQRQEFERFAGSASRTIDRMISRNLTRADFSFEIQESGEYRIFLESYGLENFDLDTTQPLSIEIDGVGKQLKFTGDSDSFLVSDLVFFENGEHKISFFPKAPDLIVNGDFSKQVTSGGGNMELEIFMDESGNKYLSMYNKEAKKNTLDFVPTDFDPFADYLIEIRYKQIFGDTASVSLEQGNERTLVKAQVEGMPSLPEWRDFSFYFQPVRTNSRVSVRLMAPARENSLGTKIYYDNLSMHRVFTNNMILVSEPDMKLLTRPKVTFQKISPVKYEGKVEGVEGPHVIKFLENYSNNWEFGISGTDGSKLLVNPIHFSADLYANAWYIGNAPKTYKFVIYYKPQNIFYIGAAISILVIVGVTGNYFIIKVLKQKD